MNFIKHFRYKSEIIKSITTAYHSYDEIYPSLYKDKEFINWYQKHALKILKQFIKKFLKRHIDILNMTVIDGKSYLRVKLKSDLHRYLRWSSTNDLYYLTRLCNCKFIYINNIEYITYCNVVNSKDVQDDYLYYAATKGELKNIFKNGLRVKYSNYNETITKIKFFEGKNPNDLLDTLVSYSTAKKLYLLKIDLSKCNILLYDIDDSLRFGPCPCSHVDYKYYTYDTIPTEAISIENEKFRKELKNY